MNSDKQWVLQLCHSYNPPFDDVARQWAALFDGTGYKVLTVFLTGKPEQPIIDHVKGDKVQFLGYTSKDLRGFKRAQIKAIRKLHQSFDFEFAIAHRYKSTYIATHTPKLFVIGVSHAYGVYNRFSRRWYINRCQQQLALVGVSNAIRDDARKAFPDWATDRIQTLYNRINIDTFIEGQVPKEIARTTLKLQTDTFIIGHVGRLHPDKDQQTLLEGFAQASANMPNAQLVLIGTGREELKLKTLAKTLCIDSKVLFLGKVPEAWRYFKAFDIFALSSNREPFGMVLLEAMIARVPVISTNCGGAPEVLGNKGLLFPLGDSAALASALCKNHAHSANEKQQQGQSLYDRATQLFSDVPAQTAFWSLPFMSPYINKIKAARLP